ncbi:MAG: amidinotransferase [Candidatus Peregrinibacteria bacterium]|nr:amidinotransferase [Candidatus Peregrinibacteria bacterium]
MKKNNGGIVNPFGRLKRMIVGVIDGAMVPELDISVEATMPKSQIDFFRKNGGKPFPAEYVQGAKRELDTFAAWLENEGVIVDRPKVIDLSKPIITPFWQTQCGLYAAMPRDILLVADNKIVVSPMSWRCRYTEVEAYEGLLEMYKSMGYEILIAPKPLLKDELYKKNRVVDDEHFISILSETEPVFDAADFLVLGKTILAQESHVTNKSGIEWLRNALGDEYNIYTVKVNDSKPMHIDTGLLPLREGLMLVNPERVDIPEMRMQLPAQFKHWEFINAPTPVVRAGDPPKFMSSDWLSMNIITIDAGLALIEEDQEPLAELLEKYDFKVARLPFKNFQCFGGSFHCATQEIARE